MKRKRPSLLPMTKISKRKENNLSERLSSSVIESKKASIIQSTTVKEKDKTEGMPDLPDVENLTPGT